MSGQRSENVASHGVVLTTAPMPLIHTCSACKVQWSGHHECPSVNRSTSAPRFTQPLIVSNGRPVPDLLRIAAVAGDLWNELENLREFWQDTPQASLIEGYIAEYEQAAGIGHSGNAEQAT